MEGLANIFYNPFLPTLDDYYEPWSYRYEELTNAPAGDDQPVARPVSMITGREMAIEAGPNWDDDLGGSGIYAAGDFNLATLTTRNGTAISPRTTGLFPSPTYLQPLPEPWVRCRLSNWCHLQAWRGWYCPCEPGEMPGMADVRFRLPLQKGLL